jgi:hypothetical protein
VTLDPTQAYRMLGLAPGATPEEVKTAYRDLAQVWHPDRFPDNARLREKAARNQQLINEAYAVLRALEPPPSPEAPLAHPHLTLGQRISATLGIGDSHHPGLLGRTLHVFWPDPKYRRRRRVRRPRRLIIGFLLLAAATLVTLWYEGILAF